ncbi:MAG: phosphopantothenoylcysteine decarboxylase [bacterium]|nr:phosphopantothenoylcysteine decarboxylase [bacterium]
MHPPVAIVTAGGTSEYIDDMRVVTNLSTGSLGWHMARYLQKRGFHVIIHASRASISALGPQIKPLPKPLTGPGQANDHLQPLPELKVIPFFTSEDLRTNLVNSLHHGNHNGAPADIIFMAAAVSDYIPQKTPGKISSAAETLTLRFSRNEKILPSLRQLSDPETTIVGFKLHSGLKSEDVQEKVSQQIDESGVNYVIVNDSASISEHHHAIEIYCAEKRIMQATDNKEELGQKICECIIHDSGLAKKLPLPAASICLRSAQGTEYLLGQRLRPPLQDLLAFPGGKFISGETPKAAALRELAEECGIELQAEKLRDAASFILHTTPADEFGQRNNNTSYAVFCFNADIPTTTPARPSSEMHAHWMTIKEALNNQLAPGVSEVLTRLETEHAWSANFIGD